MRLIKTHFRPKKEAILQKNRGPTENILHFSSQEAASLLGWGIGSQATSQMNLKRGLAGGTSGDVRLLLRSRAARLATLRALGKPAKQWMGFAVQLIKQKRKLAG
jgi:hypothetical protein